jgi:hypothetical protein
VEKKRGRGLAEFRLTHPLVFGHLAAWLRVLAHVARSEGDVAAAIGKLPAESPFFRADLLQPVLEKMGAFEAVREAASAARDPDVLLRRLHTWFDAFRTLKLVHGLRDAGFPSMPWRQALAEAPFTGLVESTREDTEELRGSLAREERKLTGRRAGVTQVDPDPEAGRGD